MPKSAEVGNVTSRESYPTKKMTKTRVHLYIRRDNGVANSSQLTTAFFHPDSLDQYCNMTSFTIQPNEEHLLVDYMILDNPSKRLAYKVKLTEAQTGWQITVALGTPLSQLFNTNYLHVQQIEWTQEVGKLF